MSRQKTVNWVNRSVMVDEQVWNAVREKLGVHGEISAIVREFLSDWLEQNSKPRHRYSPDGEWIDGVAPELKVGSDNAG